MPEIPKITIPMEVTILTAVVTIGERTVPLTRAIVKQFPPLPGLLPRDWNREDVQLIGDIELPDEFRYLYNTPWGIHYSRSLHSTLDKLNEPVKRIILTA